MSMFTVHCTFLAARIRLVLLAPPLGPRSPERAHSAQIHSPPFCDEEETRRHITNSAPRSASRPSTVLLAISASASTEASLPRTEIMWVALTCVKVLRRQDVSPLPAEEARERAGEGGDGGASEDMWEEDTALCSRDMDNVLEGGMAV